MIASLVEDLFKKIGQEWKIGGEHRPVEESDVEKVLDEAAVRLYDREVGTQLETGGLIIEKTRHGFDVYAYVGPYQ